MTRVLKPIYTREKYHDPLADLMIQKLYDLIFKSIFEILNTKIPKRMNSMADIKTAIRAGRIYYSGGYFFGQFNSVVGTSLRAIGAKWSKQKKGYKLELAQIPMDLRTDIVIGKGVQRAKTEAVLKHLEGIKGMVIQLGSGSELTDVVFDDLNTQIIKTFKVLPESMQIPMQLSDKLKRGMQDAFTIQTQGYLNDWKQEQIERLREKTQENAVLGYRSDRLAKIVKGEFDVSAKRAKFIARQETSLLVSKYREERYQDAGVKEYIWSTSHDERVRPDHAVLSGLKFSWDMPPITDRITGARHNPGEDFSCRCLALPVVNIRS